MQARYLHDCASCTYIGGFDHIGDHIDLWQCPSSGDLTCRWGDAVADNASFPIETARAVAANATPLSMWEKAVNLYDRTMIMRQAAHWDSFYRRTFG